MAQIMSAYMSTADWMIINHTGLPTLRAEQFSFANVMTKISETTYLQLLLKPCRPTIYNSSNLI